MTKRKRDLTEDETDEQEHTPKKKKMSKSERLALARANAAKSMASDKKKVQATKEKKQQGQVMEEDVSKPSPACKKVTPKKTAATPVAAATPPSTSKKARRQAAIERAQEFAENDRQNMKSPARKSAGRTPPRLPSSTRKSPARSTYAQQVAAAKPPAFILPNGSSAGSNGVSNGDLVPPPMMTRVTKRTPTKRAPKAVEPVEEEVETLETFEDEYEEMETAAKPKWTKSRKSMIVAGLVGLLSIVLFFKTGSSAVDDFLPNLDVSAKAPCFLDTSPKKDREGNFVSACPQGGEPCPKDAYCRNGILKICTNQNYEPSPNKLGCIFREMTKDTLRMWKKILEQQSVDHQCGMFFRDDLPLLPYAQLVADHEELGANPLPMDIMETAFATDHKSDGTMHIGLPQDRSADLRYPVWCKLGKTGQHWVSLAGSLVLLLSHALLSVLWTIFRKFPVMSTIVFLLAIAAKKIYAFRTYRTKRSNDIIVARNLTFEFLEGMAEEAHAVLHIRDDVVDQMVPNGGRRDREYIVTSVWPRVVPIVKEDSRVRKSKKIVDGKPTDKWQWVAASRRG